MVNINTKAAGVDIYITGVDISTPRYGFSKNRKTEFLCLGKNGNRNSGP